MANRRRPRSRLHAVMRCGLLALLILFVYRDNTALRTDSLTYTSTALPAEFDGLRIVQLSDLHNREFGKNNQRLYAAVKQAAPDLIFLTGDLVDEYAEAPIPYAKAVGKALSAIAPTVLCDRQPRMGARKRRRGGTENSPAGVRRYGALQPVRSSGAKRAERSSSPGSTIPTATQTRILRRSWRRSCMPSRRHPFWLLLAHRNTAFQRPVLPPGSGPDLLRPCPRRHLASALYRRAGRHQPAPAALLHQRLLPLYGRDCEGAEVFVSRGLGNSPKWAFRLFNRPQVAVITLKKG